MEAIHETTKAVHDAGAFDKRAMRHCDEACLTSIRERKTTGGAVSKWEL